MRSVLTVALLVACGCGTKATYPPGTVGEQLHLTSPAFTLAPGEEVWKCWYTSLSSDEAIAVTRYHSRMTPGSHHFIFYTLNQIYRPDGTFEDCGQMGGASFARRVWAFAAQDPDVEFTLPGGVAFALKGRQPVMFDMHYLNASPNPLDVSVSLDIDTVLGPYEQAGALISYNTQIAVPAHGTQTVDGSCMVPSGAKFFTMGTHSHRYTTQAAVSRIAGDQIGERLVTTDDWERPGFAVWRGPFLTLETNERIHYTCSYRNDTDEIINVGESATRNEMCMAVGYYFPAEGNTFCLNSR